MRVLIIIAALLLTACNEGQTFRQIHAMCEQSVPTFQLGQCLEFGLNEKVPNWRYDKHASYVNAYIAWLNAAGERVVKSEMTENDMRFGAAELLNRMRAEVGATRGGGDMNMAMFLTGMAILSSNQGYQPPPPTTATFWSPGTRPINCTQMGNVVNCF